MKVKCVNVDYYDQLTQGKVYKVLRNLDNDYLIINDSDCECRYEKDIFVNADEANAYDKITSATVYTTTDGDQFIFEQEAVQHQIGIDKEAAFVGIPTSKGNTASLCNMLVWITTNPESWKILKESAEGLCYAES